MARAAASMGGWHDDLKFDPLEFLERPAVLIPRPRINLVLYYEELASRARTRGGRDLRGSVHRDHSRAGDPAVSDTPKRDGSSCRRCGACLWAELMRRTFAFDVLACPRCGGRLPPSGASSTAPPWNVSCVISVLPTDRPEPWPARTPPFRSHPSGAVRREEALRFEATF